MAKITIDEIFDKLEKYSKDEKYIFRGVTNKGYDLIPSFIRIFNKEKRHKSIDDLIDNHNALIKYLDEISNHRVDLAYMLAQHYGIGTKLLDFSSDYLVALMFSVNEWIEDKKNNNRTGAVYVINKKMLNILDSKNEIKELIVNQKGYNQVIVDPSYSIEEGVFNLNRLKKQKGLFLYFKSNTYTKLKKGVVVDKIEIPRKIKSEIRFRLDDLGYRIKNYKNCD